MSLGAQLGQDPQNTACPWDQEGVWGNWEEETQPLRDAFGPHSPPQVDWLPLAEGAQSRALQ